MKTIDGYSKEKFTDDHVLLAGGSAKALSDFIGALSWDSTNKKIKYTPVGGSATDLVTLSWDNISGKPSSFTAATHTHNMNDILWPGGHNLKTSATANGQEWSIDLTPGTYTGTYWHVWRATTSGVSVTGTLLKVDSDTGKVSAPYGFVGNLTGYADYLNGKTFDITVEGDADTYYPVQLPTTLRKSLINTISVWKNLGTPTAAYTGNHSSIGTGYPNGSCSCWYEFIGRSNSWDGNGGYYYTRRAWYGYAPTCSHAEAPGSPCAYLIIWLRGGGTAYKVSINFETNDTPVIYYESHTYGSGSSAKTVAPRTDIGNAGKIDNTYIGNVTGSAGSVAWGNITGKPSTFSPSTHAHSAADITSGTLAVARGGTNKSSWTKYGVVYASDTTTLAQTSLPTWAASTTYVVKVVTNASKVPSFSIGTLSWDNITGKPSTFEPATHSHSNYITFSGDEEISGAKTFQNEKWILKASESNEIKNKQWANSTYYKFDDSAVVTSLSAITNSIQFRWYNDYWNIGVVRSGSSDSYGFAIGLQNSGNTHVLDLFRVNKDGTGYLKGNEILTTASTIAASSVAWDNITGKPNRAGSDSDGGPAQTVKGAYTSSGGKQNPNYFGTNKVGFLMMNTTVNNNSQFKDWIIMDCYNGNDVGGGVAFGVNRQNLGAYIMRSASARTSWAESAELIGTHNYTTYTVKKDGTGASGSWGISITGSAGSVAWDNITGKPDSFTASTHNHALSDINSGFGAAYRIIYSTSASATSTLAANTTTTKKFLTMTGTGSAGAAPTWGTVSWSDVGSKPSSFTPSTHSHDNYVVKTGDTMSGTLNSTSTTPFQFYGNGDGTYTRSVMYVNSNGITFETPRATDASNGTSLPFMIKTRGGQFAQIQASGFKKDGSDDTYVLLGGGGHKAISGTWDISISGNAATATLTNQAYYLETYLTATSGKVQYARGQITIGSAANNSYSGSSGTFNLWSFPADGTYTNSTSANMQVLRLSWDTTYFHDLFVCPNYEDLWHRGVLAGTGKAWRKIIDTGNFGDIKIQAKQLEFVDTHGEGNATIILGFENDLYSFFDRGGTCSAYEVAATMTNFTPASLTKTSTTVAPLDAGVFNSRLGYNQGTVYSGTKFAVYDLTLPETLYWTNTFFWSFGSVSWKPTKMRILTALNTGTYTSRYTTDDCSEFGKVKIEGGSDGFNKVRIVVSAYQRLSGIGIKNYGGKGSETTFLSRCVSDNNPYRSINPGKTNTYTLGTNDLKWNAVYATNFYGTISNATNAGYATSAGTAAAANYLHSFYMENPASCYEDTKLKWFSPIPRVSASVLYAGTTAGFPVTSNANGILYLSTYEGKYGGQLGVSSNGKLYYRFITNNNFPTTENGGSWNTLMFNTDTIVYYDYYTTNPNIDTLLDQPYLLTVGDTGNWGSGTKPSGSSNAVAILNAHTHTGNYYSQLCLDSNNNRLWIRSAHNVTAYGDWAAMPKIAVQCSQNNVLYSYNAAGDIASSTILSFNQTAPSGYGSVSDTALFAMGSFAKIQWKSDYTTSAPVHAMGTNICAFWSFHNIASGTSGNYIGTGFNYVENFRLYSVSWNNTNGLLTIIALVPNMSPYIDTCTVYESSGTSEYVTGYPYQYQVIAMASGPRSSTWTHKEKVGFLCSEYSRSLTTNDTNTRKLTIVLAVRHYSIDNYFGTDDYVRPTIKPAQVSVLIGIGNAPNYSSSGAINVSTPNSKF